ncbi:amino acid aminotransferase [Microbulbifer thermotolerans]|uniref:Aminotransferase n=1 Tax=Microbulbifer thermotolerans TaxID=252514 RepID=A0A143HKY2_MICTH|nr:amino acid aminotransferase [Microbulbifer thermotolerans]AMX02385.1 aromatic amino acid aminotransferase [Microbulbifer thermotolerans]MCX2779967.1 aspartate/tyrosine/aromatic aminotransferase [Microbulbifer thermotolerans]MCX2781836.1 aspartate/tyrosine/aromatic aminotransferase [Microbulbifer thermotolerans]MCX2795177.1 aspartate/tyrosine/aromatic aminotransferase [Microbulbifer thermotolerans]MCX2801794.1 aspartate/tyrosine/aromatic aminotransferase [Microbulbifer thermotolerans]
MFEQLNSLPPDPILGLLASYRADENPNKIDLGVGVYKDEAGHTPVLQAVKEAETRLLQSEETKAYIGPAGTPGFNAAMQELILGADHPVLRAGRVRSAQTPGGCGALRVLAEFVNRAKAGATIWVSDPTWANHVPLLGNAGLKIETYPYYDRASSSLQFDRMVETLKLVGEGDLVLLHACCHNPCGADLSREQWQVIAEMAQKQGFTPFIDMAYQGFGDSLDDDAWGLRLMAESVPEMLVAASCSKNFGLYRERVGLAMAIYNNGSDADKGQSQMLNVVRGNYSMPPSHGAAIVESILTDAGLKANWMEELAEMRERINGLRAGLVENLAAAGASGDFSFIQRQKGMFSFLGITPEQVQRLQTEYSIYMVDSSRISIAGLSQHNMDYFCKAVASIL